MRVKTFFRLPPELGDGQHWEICGDPEIVAQRVREWASEAIGWDLTDSIMIETVRMADSEVEALPEL